MFYVLLFIGINLTVLQADLSSEEIYGIRRFSTIAHHEEGYLYPLAQQCEEILYSFAEHASNFTKCSIRHARPIRFCEKCIDQYTSFRQKYKELLDTKMNGTTCKSVFISQDRLDIVLDYHDSILAVWDKGNCNACFDWPGSAPELRNNTKRFYRMFNETMDCIMSNWTPAGNNTEAVCEKCMQLYVQLDEFYQTLSKDGIGVDTVCFDIVDSMNATRSIWSKSLNCCKLRRTPEVIFLCCTAIISLLPVLFYLGVRYCGPIMDLPNVLKQSRIKQTILRALERR